MTFSAGRTALCTAKVSHGTASCTTTKLKAGIDHVTARFAGVPGTAASTSTSLVETVVGLSITVHAPRNGASYPEGSTVKVGFSCKVSYGHLARKNGCTATAGNGSSLNTRTPGRHTFTVTVTSSTGARQTDKITYTVKAS